MIDSQVLGNHKCSYKKQDADELLKMILGTKKISHALGWSLHITGVLKKWGFIGISGGGRISGQLFFDF